MSEGIIYTYIHMYTYMHIYIYIYVVVCCIGTRAYISLRTLNSLSRPWEKTSDNAIKRLLQDPRSLHNHGPP